jgi:hypothetical protein
MNNFTDETKMWLVFIYQGFVQRVPRSRMGNPVYDDATLFEFYY